MKLMVSELQYLMSEWSHKNTISPFKTSHGSKKMCIWVCVKNHEWIASPNTRYKGRGCPYCANKKINDSNCLMTLNPELSQEWNYNKNILLPTQVSCQSGKKVWWKCKKDHEWESVVKDRHNGNGCPYCANRKVCMENCLLTVNPKLASEWNYEKNYPTCPEHIVYGTNKKFWWICNKKHTWQASVFGRRYTGCPICRNSKGEIKVAEILSIKNIEFFREFKFNTCRHVLPLPFDFYFIYNGKPCVIEYQGEQHYNLTGFGSNPQYLLKRIQRNDAIKKEFCLQNSIRFLTIPFHDFNIIETIIDNFLTHR